MEKVNAIERELYGEIVQIKKERLVQVTVHGDADDQDGVLRLADLLGPRAIREVSRPDHHRASRL